jgi:hypothetical protein
MSGMASRSHPILADPDDELAERRRQ